MVSQLLGPRLSVGAAIWSATMASPCMKWRTRRNPSLFFFFFFMFSMSSLMADIGDRRQPLHCVLVHGAGHGAWCWYKVQTLLQTAGHKVTSLDLASAGIDRTDPDELLTFQDYDKPLIDFLLSLPQGQKVVLVGHSMGGLSLTHAMHLFGTSKISAAVFAAASMLRSGMNSTQEDIDMVFLNGSEGMKAEFGQERQEASAAFGFPYPPDPKYMRELFYNESPEEDVTLALTLVKPTVYRLLPTARFNDTGVDIDGVWRMYVKTGKDRVVKPEQQDGMIRDWPPNRVLRLSSSDHSLFFSAPEQFVERALLQVGTLPLWEE